MSGTAADAGRGIGRRLRDLSEAVGRYDRFVFERPGAAPTQPVGQADATAAAQALVLRALRVASDPVSWQVLDRLRAGDTTTSELAAALGCPRLVAWDHVDQLVQVGLAGRDLDGDRVGISQAGCVIAEFVEAATAAAAQEVQR